MGGSRRTSGLEDPEGLAQDPGFVRREVDDAVGDDRVRPVVFARQVLDLPEPELQAGRGELGLEGFRPRPREHLGCHVDAHDAPRGSHGVCGEEAVYSRAAAEVEHVLPGLEPRQTDGRAAADAEVRVAHERQIRGGVPNGAAVLGRGDAAPGGVVGHLGVVGRHRRALRGAGVGGVGRRLDRHRHRPHREHRASRDQSVTMTTGRLGPLRETERARVHGSGLATYGRAYDV